MIAARMIVAAVFVLACDAKPEAAALEPKAAPVERPADTKPVDTNPVDTKAAPEPGPAAAGSAATREQREQAVLAILQGATPADQYAVVDVDDGAKWEPGLRDRIAPREPLSGVSKVRMPDTSVTAGLDKDIVRRIVRAHVNEIRFCYNQALTRNAEIRGSVVVALDVGSDGAVTSTEIESSTLAGGAGETAGACMLKAVRRWKFPKPEGSAGTHILTTFELAPR